MEKPTESQVSDDKIPLSDEPSSRPKQSSTRPLLSVPLISLDAALKEGLEQLRHQKPLHTMWPRMERLCQPTSGRFWVIGGRPGNYKTQVMWNLALDMASRQHKVLFLSLEEEPWAMSLAASARFSQIPRDRLRAAELAGDAEFLTSAEVETLNAAEEKLRGLEFHMRLHGADKHGRSLNAVLRSACRSRFDAVFVDHLGMVARQGPREFDEIPKAVDSFRALARGELAPDYRPFVCIASPLNRVREQTGDEDDLPQMSDLRGSGRIESDADLVMILQKRKQDEESNQPDVLDGFVVKNRHGRCPVVLLFEANGATCSITERHSTETPPPHWQDREDS